MTPSLHLRLLVAGLLSGLIGTVAAVDPGPPRVGTDPTDLRGNPGLGTTSPGLPNSKPETLAPSLLPALAPGNAAEGTLAAGLKFFAREYHFSGNTVFTAEELAALATPYANREVTSEDLANLRQALTLHYVEHGYVNSGAVIPDQQITNGVVEISLIEGRLTAIEVAGNRRLRASYLSDRLRRGAGPPLNVAELQAQLQILLSGPFVSRINGELAPGEHPGEAILTARIEEKRPYSLSVGVNNDLTPSLGEVRGVLQAAAYSPTGLGDILSTELAYADGAREAQLGYSIPVNSRGTSLDVFGDWSKGEVVEERLSGLNIEGETTSVGARLNHALHESAREQLGLSLGFDARHSTTSLLGRGFAFSPGVEPDGDSQVSVLRCIQNWSLRGPSQVFAIRSTLSLGIDALDATRNSGKGPDGKFVAWLGQAQWARRLPWLKSQLVFRLDGQWAADPLLPLEQFAVGGGRTVRGYAKNVLVRDHGFATSLELRVPLLRNSAGLSVLEFAPFVDAGGAWFNGREGPAPEVIPAIGFGLRSDPHPKVHAELYWGHALKDIPGAGDSPQEDGIYFTLVADVFR